MNDNGFIRRSIKAGLGRADKLCNERFDPLNNDFHDDFIDSRTKVNRSKLGNHGGMMFFWN